MGAEKIWHKSQKIKKNGDGSLDLTFQAAGLDEIKRWILSLGPACQVLEPNRLKTMVSEDVGKVLTYYKHEKPEKFLSRYAIRGGS